MVRSATKIRLPKRATGATAYIALLAVAALQLGFALHHDQHSATDLTSTCVACVQLEQFDDLVATTGTAFVVEPEGVVATTPVATAAVSRMLRSYYGRAPPAHS